MAPIVLRDVNVFQRKYQVGQGTYGSVFVGQDKVSNEIVALKRINTKQEENGFPITALREVKILKALTHPNIVTLKEIVTSKGMFLYPCRSLSYRRACFARCSFAHETACSSKRPQSMRVYYHGSRFLVRVRSV